MQTTVPNQKVITVHKVRREDDTLFTMFPQYVQQRMMNDLHKVGSIKLWLYLSKNQDAYVLALSPADAAKWGIGPDAYKAGIKDLVGKGYLRQTGAKNNYVFYDLPQPKTQDNQINIALDELSAIIGRSFPDDKTAWSDEPDIQEYEEVV